MEMSSHYFEVARRRLSTRQKQETYQALAMYRVSIYDTWALTRRPPMIKSYADEDTEQIARGIRVRAWVNIESPLRRKLQYLNAAVQLDDLKAPPGNRLEALKGDREGQFSIRVNDQYRICFRWDDGNAYDVEVVDYH